MFSLMNIELFIGSPQYPKSNLSECRFIIASVHIIFSFFEIYSQEIILHIVPIVSPSMDKTDKSILTQIEEITPIMSVFLP
jgi:hypothetical protein